MSNLDNAVQASNDPSDEELRLLEERLIKESSEIKPSYEKLFGGSNKRAKRNLMLLSLLKTWMMRLAVN